MCARFTLATQLNLLLTRFLVTSQLSFDFQPSYNIAPSQPVLCVVTEGQERVFTHFRWGFQPPWAKDKVANRALINARAETAADKPTFRHAFRRQRCLIVADGFYEWMTVNKRKIPYWFHLKDREPFAFAGIWSESTCALLTTEPNEVIKPVHDRMPVILRPEHEADWLDPRVNDPEYLRSFLQPYPAERMSGYAVSPRVNSPKHDDPLCIAPVSSS